MISRSGALSAALVGAAVLIGAIGPSRAADPVKIGVLTESWGPYPNVLGLREGLRELGYRENHDFVIGVRFTQGDPAALAEGARDLLRDGADILFTTLGAAAVAAKAATTRVPIVFAGTDTGADPVQLGLVKSIARPGGNVTGVTDLGLELAAKRVELFRELVPRLRRILAVYVADNPIFVAEVAAYRNAARRLGVALVEIPVRTQAEAEATFAGLRGDDTLGILAPQSVSLNIPAFALAAGTRLGLPTMFPSEFFVRQGGLAGYGPDYHETGRQAARMVDNILKGRSPGEIPVESNPRIEFVLNASTARALRLTPGPEVLARVDRLLQ